MNSDIVIHVKDGVVFLIGHIKSFAEKRSLIGQEIWNTYGVVKILNDLQQVTEPETAGPIKKALEITR
jgi:osmotically-inducible protein OsmY